MFKYESIEQEKLVAWGHTEECAGRMVFGDGCCCAIGTNDLNDQQLSRLYSYADCAAGADLEQFCRAAKTTARPDGDGFFTWFDLNKHDPDFLAELTTALWWLRLRGLIVENESKRNLVRVIHGRNGDGGQKNNTAA